MCKKQKFVCACWCVKWKKRSGWRMYSDVLG